MATRKKGREKRAGTTDEGTGLVRVKLTEEQWRERSDELASCIKKAEDVESKKSAAAEKYNGELKLLKTRISILADEVDTREANVEAQVALDLKLPTPGNRRQRLEAEAAAAAAGEGVPANDAELEGAAV